MAEQLASQTVSPQERGPWSIAIWDGKTYLQTHGFTHDVTLQISGDFEDKAQEFAYAQELVRQLNAQLPVSAS